LDSYIGEENERGVCKTEQGRDEHMGMLWIAEWSGGWEWPWLGWTSDRTLASDSRSYKKGLPRWRLVALNRPYPW